MRTAATAESPLGQWAPISLASRSSVDHAAADGRDDVVLVHLNHRLVQMSLRLLRAEVWSVKGRKRMHRITARLVPNHILNAPAVVAHARLVVIGGDTMYSFAMRAK